MSVKRLWIFLAIFMVAAFAALGFLGREIQRAEPPIPTAVVDNTGHVIYTRDDIENGQLAWQSMGGMEVGSIWGHGAYVAPDWSADQLHRETVALRDIWAARENNGAHYEQLDRAAQAGLDARAAVEMRSNTYDPVSGRITVSTDRAQAIAAVRAHYMSLFSNDPATEELREQYAMTEGALQIANQPAKLRLLARYRKHRAISAPPGHAPIYNSTVISPRVVREIRYHPSERRN